MLIIFIYSSYNIYIILKGYIENKKVYDNINEIVRNEKDEINLNKEKYNKLKSINEDYRFWIYIPQTNISYPVVYGRDNEEYLYKNFEGNENNGGSIFIDYRNTEQDTDNLIIHGHNMKDKSMFGAIPDMLKEEYFNENTSIYIYLQDQILEYKIFSAYVNHGDFNPYINKFNSDEEFNEYINIVRSKSYFEFDYIDNNEKNILTLSTCTNATGIERTIIHAKLISNWRD